MAKVIDMIPNPNEVSIALAEKFGVHIRKSTPKRRRPKKNVENAK